ncbi:MAG: type II toxin-antitoxin system VapC family toxin [Pyrinomonadaceae bacterium]|nr:type II toxin-antitoxin system VapC family toxin [Pyrinomonadaceae bacterium]
MPIVESPPDLPLAIDNNVFTHLRNKQPYLLEYVKKHFVNTRRLPVIPSLILFESNFGIQKALVTNKISAEQAAFQIQEINKLASIHTVIDFNQKAAEIAAYIFARLSKSDKNQHWRDLFIAATAIANNYGLATQNKRDMELIASHLPTALDLRIAIWKP